MFFGRSWDSWIAQYGASHTHPLNRITHAWGIPMIVVAITLFAISVFVAGLWKIAAALFVLGWVLQFIGHAAEGKPPEFFQDWRFLFVGVRWWAAKMRGRA